MKNAHISIGHTEEEVNESVNKLKDLMNKIYGATDVPAKPDDALKFLIDWATKKQLSCQNQQLSERIIVSTLILEHLVAARRLFDVLGRF